MARSSCLHIAPHPFQCFCLHVHHCIFSVVEELCIFGIVAYHYKKVLFVQGLFFYVSNPVIIAKSGYFSYARTLFMQIQIL